ncbi:hypothetical protein BGZ95_001055 [Linnemannia exigua]|uniref:Uncharacterized protein n=1 Tax=Linnemannia exigua TaxID=604196 RepID=A0AAD4H3X8_9FUNG|nr:hypothetical protein BGZ95_001055 [Linnemannia exigua]
MLIPRTNTKTQLTTAQAVSALLASTPPLILLLLSSSSPVVDAAPSPIIETCFNNGCSKVFSILDPCGGGASNETLQQSLIFTPTPVLGGCQCNHEFYNVFSSCLACISSQAQSFPEIQNQQDWEENCENYGFNVTNTPTVNSTNPINGGGGSNNGGNGNLTSGGEGLSTGAIVGIVVGVLVLAGLVGALLFVRRRQRHQMQQKPAGFDPAGSPPNGSDHFDHAAAATAATSAAAVTADAADTNNAYQDYPASYQQNDYYNDQHAHYQDPSYQNNNSYAAQHAQDHSYYSNDYTNGYGNGDVNGGGNGYYDSTNGGSENIMLQSMSQGNGSSVYVPPPPHPASPTPQSDAYATSPRSSDTFPQSLRNKPKAWGTPITSSMAPPQELTSGMMSSSQFNDKTEFDDGEELEPPAPHSNEFSARRSMTPPRATMQSYRDEFNRPSIEREPRRSGSDRGSISGAASGGLNMLRASENGSGFGFNNNNGSNGRVDYDQQGEQLDFGRASQDSPEGARRRARAAELFSAEGTRR